MSKENFTDIYLFFSLKTQFFLSLFLITLGSDIFLCYLVCMYAPAEEKYSGLLFSN